MSKDPAVLFYTSDFLIGVQNLTMEERGQYITLLCLQHQHGHLAQKMIQLSVGSLSSDVLDKFSKDEQGLLYNQRMEEETLKRENFINSKRKNGSKGGRPKTDRFSVGFANENLLENENENINENINKDVNSKVVSNKSTTKKEKIVDNLLLERFDRFWAVYPRKVGKGDARKAFLKLKPSDKLTDSMIAAVEKQARSEQWRRDKGQFIPHPATWLNQERWEDSTDIEYPKVEVKEVILF